MIKDLKDNIATNKVTRANKLLRCEIPGDYEEYTHLLIPVYQRNYTWEKKEIEELYDDFQNHWNTNKIKNEEGNFVMDEEKARSYYLGNVVVVKNPKENSFGVLDGQQRITTLYIMNIVFKKSFIKLSEDLEALYAKNKLEQLEYIKHKQSITDNLNIIRSLSHHKNEKKEMSPRLTIVYKTDRDHFEEILREQFETSNLTTGLSQGHSMIKAFKILTNKLKESYDSYTEEVYKPGVKLGDKDLFEAKLHITEQMSKYVRSGWTEFNLTILQKGQEFEIFETMNDRGKELNAFDLTRNSMIAASLKLSKEEESVVAGNITIKEVQERVKNLFDQKIKENSKKGDSTRYTKNAGDFMLQSWLVTSEEKISRKKYMGAFLKLLKDDKKGFNQSSSVQKQNLLNHTVFLEETSEFHNEILNPDKINDRTSFGSRSERKTVTKKVKLVNMTGLKQFIPIYIALRLVKCSSAQIVNWLDLIEKIYVNGYLVFAYSPAKFESHLHEAAYKIYQSREVSLDKINKFETISGHDNNKLNKAYQELEIQINKIIGLSGLDYKRVFVDKMSKLEISNNRSANYLLRRIELYVQGETGEIELAEDLSLEHVLPNHYRAHWGKIKFYQNKNFPKAQLLEDNLNGNNVHTHFINRLGNHTLLTQPMNSSIKDSSFKTKKPELIKSKLTITNGSTPISVMSFKDWNAESIEKRQQELAKKGFEIWGLNI